MELYFRASFEKDLKKIKDKKLRRNIEGVVDNVKKAENLETIKNLKKLKGHKTFYRIRMGDYRIGIDIIVMENKVIFIRILHRKDIYKYFP